MDPPDLVQVVHLLHEENERMIMAEAAIIEIVFFMFFVFSKLKNVMPIPD
jgi:hypothetical protein